MSESLGLISLSFGLLSLGPRSPCLPVWRPFGLRLQSLTAPLGVGGFLDRFIRGTRVCLPVISPFRRLSVDQSFPPKIKRGPEKNLFLLGGIFISKGSCSCPCSGSCYRGGFCSCFRCAVAPACAPALALTPALAFVLLFVLPLLLPLLLLLLL